MSVQLGVLFVVVGVLLHIARWFGFFKRRRFYRLVPNFLIANGIGFFIPLPAYQDGLFLVVVALIGDEVWFHRANIRQFWQRHRDGWDKLRGM